MEEQEVKMFFLIDGYWSPMDTWRRYRFPCPEIQGRKDGHEFNMDGLSLIFASSGQEYLEGYVRCSKEGCPATMKYRIFKASAEIPDDWKRELLMR